MTGREPIIILTRRKIVVLLAIYLLLTIVASVVTGVVIRHGIAQTTAHLKAQTQRSHDNEVAACIRSDIQAAKDNKSQYADWKVFKFVGASTTAALSDPKVSAKQKRQTRQFLGTLRGSIADKAWVPLIKDCNTEVARHGANFLPARPIPFNTQEPPPSELAVPPKILPTLPLKS